jgi:pimeloyl-ACP methyl ester carboxylesterase
MKPFPHFNYYLLPGMGADHRLYSGLQLKYGTLHPLDWVPHRKAVSLAEYAGIVAERITTQNNVLIGSSMGGMVAVELSRIVRPEATILISAPAGRHEFPKILKAFDKLGIHRRLTPRQLIKLNRIASTFMGFTSPEHEKLFYEMLEGNGQEFLHFSVRAVLGWQNTRPPEGRFIQIIGRRDRLFRKTVAHTPFMVENCGHFLAYENPDAIATLIHTYMEEKILPQLET